MKCGMSIRRTRCLSFLLILFLLCFPLSSCGAKPAQGGSSDAESQQENAEPQNSEETETSESEATEESGEPLEMNIAQAEDNSPRILIENIEDGIDNLQIDGALFYRDEPVQTISLTLDDIKEGKASFDVPFYGEWQCRMAFKRGQEVLEEKQENIAVIADEYNIVPLMSSLPVLMYSLKYFSDDSMLKDQAGNYIPSIVTLSRDSQYDWNELPRTMTSNPYIPNNSEDMINTLGDKIPLIKEYVEHLLSLNPNSKFHFFFNDFHFNQGLPDLVYETNLADDRYSLVFITDGSSISYDTFKSVYGDLKNAEEKHERLIEEYKDIKERLRNGEGISDLEDTFLYQYVYAILDVEEDAEWWVIRKSASDTFLIEDEAFLQRVMDDERVSSNYINNLLAGVQEKGNEETLKKLYKFEDSAFEKIRKEGKTPMMILGTSAPVETEDPLDEYVKLTMAYYGDEYGYIHKGHPGNIPDEFRLAQLMNLGLEPVDASIAAELFMFYDPDTKIAGYPSTTFQTTEAEDNMALFLVDKDEAYHSEERLWTGVKEYAATVDFFASKVTDAKREKIRENNPEIFTHIEDDTYSYYLLEFNEGQPYSFGIWTVELGTLDLF